jgi:hypothetical protein
MLVSRIITTQFIIQNTATWKYKLDLVGVYEIRSEDGIEPADDMCL